MGHNLRLLKKIKIQELLFIEIFFFAGLIILSSQLQNPYLIGLILAVIIGYYHSRRPIIEEHYLNHFLINKRYKATMLSIKAQIGRLFEAGFILIIGFMMAVSFDFGFLVSGISMFLLLIIIYPFVRKALNK